jgi:putative transposase
MADGAGARRAPAAGAAEGQAQDQRARRGERWALRTDDRGAPLARRARAAAAGSNITSPAAAGGAAGAGEARPWRRERRVERARRPRTGALWSWYRRPERGVKAEAARRRARSSRVEELERGNLTRSAAIACVAAEASDVASSTLWGWLALVDGVERARPAAVPRAAAHRRRRTRPRSTTAPSSSCLRLSAARAADLVELLPADGRRLCAAARNRRALQPDAAPQDGARDRRPAGDRQARGRRRAAQDAPAAAAERRRAHALELVNIDGHKFDVFVRVAGRRDRPADDGRDPGRLQPQDSRLAHRRDRERGPDQARLRRPVRNWGIPAGCLLDNGRAFASKWITGGAKTRFRFKIREEEPTGILTALGVRIHWAQPYRGQSKPIERAFRDLCDTIAKHPALAGAYTGNHIDAKPENYGERAVPIDLFVEVVERGIAAHNARPAGAPKRRNGRSFDEVFEASYVRSRSAKRRRSSCAWRCSRPTRSRPTASRARSRCSATATGRRAVGDRRARR